MNSETLRSRSRAVRLVAVILVCCSATLLACQVPVFRYALERWNADQYRVTVLHDQPLTASQQEALESLRKAALATPDMPASLDLQVLDLSGGVRLSPQMQAQWQQRAAADEPLVLVEFPRANETGRTEPVYAAALTAPMAAQLLDSPVRQEVVARLAAGHSAVWVFVPCGREAEDSAALKRLDAQLDADEDWLEIPSAEELEVQPEVLEQVKVPLQIQFSVVTLRRDDPAEKFLLQSLLLSEEDLTQFDQPLAFPVFGQGRVLYALVGQGIATDTIRTASAFMCGPCSCQVKNQNPGFDLLLRTDWKARLGDVLISEPVETVDKEANAPTLLAIPPGRKAASGGTP